MTIEYEIKTSPDPVNPNEQPEGSIIIDDRLYGYDRLVITTDNQSYNRKAFTKPLWSNKLESSILTFTDGQIITLTCEQYLG